MIRARTYQNSSGTTIRKGNLTTVLQRVLDDSGEATRASIARGTGLTSATVSSLVAELIETGYVEETGRTASNGGKPATRLQVNADAHGIVVLVARPHLVRSAIVGLDGRVVSRSEHRAGGGLTPQRLVETAASSIAKARRNVLAIGVQAPGICGDGRVRESVQLGWHDEEVQQPVASAAGVPAHLINDADAEALAELIPSPSGDHLYLHLGQGVGAAIVHAGSLFQGTTGRAGEVGHLRVDDGGTPCRCGSSGCLEATASMTAMLGDGFNDELSSRSVKRLAAADGATARITIGIRSLARAIRMMCATLDITDVVVGGAASALGADFFTRLQHEIDEHQPRGTREIAVRSATNRDPFLGPAQHALMAQLGVHWRHVDSLDG
ncbi:MAG: ROK family transcriptional regulator [Microbacterium sp.]